MKIRTQIVDKAIEEGNGVLRLDPAWVARSFLAPGRRLGLDESQYELGERGGICERWIASTTKADNKVSVPDEGLSFLRLESDQRMTLKEAVDVAGTMIMGAEYARSHPTLDRLAKIFDYGDRLPFHLHQMKQHAALVGRNSKEESYFYPEGLDMGPHPETFLGVHPYITAEKKHDLLLPHLQRWDSDLILQHSRAYLLLPGDGFHTPAGVVHAPGSALTIELQEDSDVLAMLQAKVGDRWIDKELLFKDVRPEDRARYGERIILDMIDWETCGDPLYYENRHTPPILIPEKVQSGGYEEWIFYNTRRYSGKRLVVNPGMTYTSIDAGVFNILVWKGRGEFDGHAIEGRDPMLDELLVCHDRAVAPLLVRNTGREELVIFKFFGPDINPDVPMLVRKTIS
jgi:hypothetical protein